MTLPDLHARIVQVASELPEARTLALAGGGAMLAHGIVERETKDVDLFTDRDADEAVRIAAALRSALLAAGLEVAPAARPPHENRFVVLDTSSEEQVQVEVFADGGRLHPPVQLAVGPVLHLDDLAADKTLALWGRGEPRDFLDVVALLVRYPEARLLELAGSKDCGFTTDSFGTALAAVQRISDARWAAAGISADTAVRVKDAVLLWRQRLG